MKPDQDRVRHLLTDTVTLLCKNGLQYEKELRVQGLLGITLDDTDVFVVHINEKFGDLIGGVVSMHSADCSKATDEKQTPQVHDDVSVASDIVSVGQSHDALAVGQGHDSTARRRRKRRRSSGSKSDVSPPPPLPPDGSAASPENASLSQNASAADITTECALIADIKVEKDVKMEHEEDVIIVEHKDTKQSHDASHNMAYGDMSLGAVNYDPFASNVLNEPCVDPGVDPGGGDQYDPRRIATAWDSTALQQDSGYTNSGQLSTWDTAQLVTPATATTQLASTSSAQYGSDQIPSADILTRNQQQKHVFSCDYPDCQGRFKFAHSLIRHQVQKHGRKRTRPVFKRRSWARIDKEFVCNFPGCRKAYFEGGNLRQHQRKDHGCVIGSYTSSHT